MGAFNPNAAPIFNHFEGVASASDQASSGTSPEQKFQYDGRGNFRVEDRLLQYKTMINNGRMRLGTPDDLSSRISELERTELNQNANRGKDEPDQWYIMWDIAFPTARRPSSPYLGNGQEESLSLLRNFWDKRGHEIISGFHQPSCPECESQIIQNVMNLIFGQLEMGS
ncbi:hypothetical protein GGR54DRAFT_635357 [Hypoxylon sp. NC1633]|nr:hypothetical protein GGR54DRAFT_635357 [Hypoxylon sp. NC1633]